METDFFVTLLSDRNRLISVGWPLKFSKSLQVTHRKALELANVKTKSVKSFQVWVERCVWFPFVDNSRRQKVCKAHLRPSVA